MKKEEYLTIMEGQIRCRQARAGVREELNGHIEDQMEAYQAQGMTAEEAEETAVLDMGDPVETGNEMDRIHRPRMPWKSIAVIIIISLVTFFLQYILRIREPSQETMVGTWIPGGQLKYLLIHVAGWCIMIGICYLDYTRIGKYALQLMLLGCVGILLMCTFGSSVNGSHYFVFLPVIGMISANMLIFLFVPLYGAFLYRYRGQGYQAVIKGILWMAPSILLILFETGIVQVFIVGAAYMVILTVAVCKNWFRVSKKITLGILWGLNLLLPLLMGAYIMNRGAGYQQARLQAVLHPYSTEAGYSFVMLRKLLAGSRLLGTKQGFHQDAGNVVESGSNALSMICAYYGVLVAVVLAAGIVLLFLWFFQKALGQKNQMGMIMGTGISAVFLVELLLYIMGNMGWIFGTSYCPFLGYGGSGTMVTYILLGILLSIYRYENVAPEVKMERRVPAL